MFHFLFSSLLICHVFYCATDSENVEYKNVTRITHKFTVKPYKFINIQAVCSFNINNLQQRMEIPSMLVQIAPTNSTNTFCIYSKVYITYCFSVKFVWVKNKKKSFQMPLLVWEWKRLKEKRLFNLNSQCSFFIVFLLKDEKSDVILHRVITIARHYISHKLFS